MMMMMMMMMMMQRTLHNPLCLNLVFKKVAERRFAL